MVQKMVKDKRRNSEKRKEKSRDAARCRRGKETEVFLELSNSLPLQESVSSQLDKASVMRLAISKLKIDNIFQRPTVDEDATECNEIKTEDKFDQYYQKALEGFVLIFSVDGDIIYLSETVVKYLGLQQLDLMGQSIYDFTHPCDHDEIKEMTLKSGGQGSRSGEDSQSDSREFFIRMKCTLTSKGRSVNLKSATYKVMKCTGRLVTETKTKESSDSEMTSDPSYLVCVAEPIPHPANIEVTLDSKTFLSKHNMDMSFIFCDERISELAGYNSEDMVNQSFYDFHHALDSSVVDKAFKNLFSKGQTVTGAYRFLARTGGYMWVVTQATVINNSRTQKPQSVVCVHYVLSGVEKKELILSHVQGQQTKKSLPAQVYSEPDLSSLLPPKMELNTENIFAPKTKEMEQGYFVPPEMKDTMIYLNNEPEDLSYLAPSVCDESVPLPIFHFADNVADTGVCMLKQEPPTASVTPEPSYRQSFSPTIDSPPVSSPQISPPPHLSHQFSPTPRYSQDHSPTSLMSSNTSSRISSPHDYLSMSVPDDFDTMDRFFQSIKTGEVDNEGIDFNNRAPYIPMDGEEDLVLLGPSSTELFNLSEDINPGIFGGTESVFAPKDALFETPPEPPKRRMRDMLEESTALASIEQPTDTMHMQLKRRLDHNSLEKGPPKPKLLRMGQETAPCSTSSGLFQNHHSGQSRANNRTKDSVLMNLLLSGEDRNHGYKMKNVGGTMLNQVQLQNPLLTQLTCQDYEVNAPAQGETLVQGQDIYRALDVKVIRSYSQQMANLNSC